MTRQGGDIRVLVIDDSQTARELLVAILQTSEGIRVIGSGANGVEAVRLTKRMRPDVLLMDINMPKLDGLEATREIMSEIPTPIVLITGTLMLSDMDLSFKALQAGALTVIPKPGLSDPEACDLVVERVRAMADVPIVRRWRRDKQRRAQPSAPQAPVWSTPSSAAKQLPRTHVPSALSRSELERPFRLIGIGASTGGPGALATILRPLPADFPVPILIVQHVTPGFAIGLAEWIDSETEIRVQLAAHGRKPEPGSALIAPDAYHMQVNFRGLIELNKEPAYKGLRPSVNYLFDSMARTCGPRALGILMTGMGDDGADGLKALYDEGGLTIAQDEATCIVYGMPREAVIRGGVSAILSLDEIAQTLSYLIDGVGEA
jgi:two-component system chemotaxis response regulator CheB